MSEYDRLVTDEDGRDDHRYRQRQLRRWRISMLFSFASGAMLMYVAYPKLHPCADVQAEIAGRIKEQRWHTRTAVCRAVADAEVRSHSLQ